MKTKNQFKKLRSDQRGIASMVIVILIMTILTLVVIALAKNANQEQRQALDRQLNSQAFYAAESGVNDARDYISQKNGAGESVEQQKTNCDKTSDAEGNEYFGGISSSLDIEGVAYSCVMYDLTPGTLEFSDVKADTSKYVLLSDANGNPIDDLTISWNQTDGGGVFTGCPSAPGVYPTDLPDNCDAGVLRIGLIKETGSTNRQELIDNSFIAFASPGNNATVGSTSYASGLGHSNQGVTVRGGCQAGSCTVNIANIDERELFLHLRSLYRNNKVTVSATATSGAEIKFRDAQMVVDATGKAQDVLKRINVRVPLNPEYNKARPEFVLQTGGDLCKLLNVSRDEDDNITVSNECE